MMQKRWNAILDCMMVLLLLLLMAYPLIGESIHEWLGIAMLLLFLGHHALNWRWYRSLPHEKWPPVRVFQTVVNTALLLVMVGSAVSGIIISRYVFSLLRYGQLPGPTPAYDMEQLRGRLEQGPVDTDTLAGLLSTAARFVRLSSDKTVALELVNGTIITQKEVQSA